METKLPRSVKHDKKFLIKELRFDFESYFMTF